METFGYKAQLYLEVWQEVELEVEAQSKEEADAMIIELAKKNPLSMDSNDENIEITNTEYLTETESLINKADWHTVQVYDEACENCVIENALYTNGKKTRKPSLRTEFNRIAAIREEYTQNIKDILTRLLKRKKSPVILANEEDEVDDSVDVVVAYSNHSGPVNGRVLSAWLSGTTICLKVEDIQGGDITDIEESDLEDDGLYFVANRILNPIS